MIRYKRYRLCAERECVLIFRPTRSAIFPECIVAASTQLLTLFWPNFDSTRSFDRIYSISARSLPFIYNFNHAKHQIAVKF